MAKEKKEKRFIVTQTQGGGFTGPGFYVLVDKQTGVNYVYASGGYGGGICQPSSALYYCTLLADLEIVQRHCHTYPSSYVPFGLDATVSWGGPDFKFKNNTDFPIRIDAAADGGSVTLTLVGTDVKDYYVKMDSEILRSISPKVEYIKVKADSGHKDGEVKTSGHTGYEVQSYKLKYSKETDELISREKEAFSASLNKDDGILLNLQAYQSSVKQKS